MKDQIKLCPLPCREWYQKSVTEREILGNTEVKRNPGKNEKVGSSNNKHISDLNKYDLSPWFKNVNLY